jgi:amidase
MKPSEYASLNAAQQLALLDSGDVSSVELTQAHLGRIDEVNAPINAIVTVDAEGALSRARQSDDARARGELLGPLAGLPMTHKDTHNVAGMRSTNGSLCLKDFVPDTDDLVVARLRASGVVATGKSNVPEFGAGSHTFNEVFGTTTNPYDTSRSAGGSSGGLAAALASGIQPLGEGSDMGGSLRIPASFCNVFGFRPSWGVIPMPSPVNAWAWLGRTGPMARTVGDLELFMNAVAGPTPEVTPGAPDLRGAFGQVPGAQRGGVRGVRGLRVGFTTSLGLPVQPAMQEAVRRAAATFEAMGATVEEASPDLTGAAEVFDATRATDFAAGLGSFVESQRELVKPEVIWNVELGWSLSNRDLLRVRALLTRLQASMREFHRRFDLLISPGAQVVAFDATQRFPAEIEGVASTTYLDWMRSACLLSAAGVPTLAAPAGFDGDGLPTGVQLSGFHYTDAELLAWGKAYEKASGHDAAPISPRLAACDARSLRTLAPA